MDRRVKPCDDRWAGEYNANQPIFFSADAAKNIGDKSITPDK